MFHRLQHVVLLLLLHVRASLVHPDRHPHRTLQQQKQHSHIHRHFPEPRCHPLARDVNDNSLSLIGAADAQLAEELSSTCSTNISDNYALLVGIHSINPVLQAFSTVLPCRSTTRSSTLSYSRGRKTYLTPRSLKTNFSSSLILRVHDGLLGPPLSNISPSPKCH